MTRKATARRLRVGVIGVGGMGHGHCAQMAEHVKEMQLAAVCDVDPATARTIGEKFKVPHFTRHLEMIRSGLCDAVTIATPHPAHAPIAIDAMNAKLHVLSEKPLCETISNAEKMVRAARKNKVAFAVMFQRRYTPQVRKAMEIVASGQIGRVMRAVLISPEYRTQAYYDSGTWRATWEGEGGGVMMNQAPHIMDIFVHLAGMPVEVCGTAATRLHRIEVEDLAEATLRFKGGGVGYFYVSTNEPGPGQMIEIFGDKGKLIYRDGGLRFFRYSPSISEFTRTCDKVWASPTIEEVPLQFKDEPVAHFTVLRNFARHILRGEPLLSPGECGLASLELANAITLSHYAGKPVRLPIDRQAYDRLLAKLRRASTFRKRGADKRVIDPQHKV